MEPTPVTDLKALRQLPVGAPVVAVPSGRPGVWGGFRGKTLVCYWGDEIPAAREMGLIPAEPPK